MNFGEILDAWEKQAGKSPPGGSRRVPQDGGESAVPGQELHRVDPLTAWLRVQGVQDKDAEEAEERKNRGSPGERRRRLLRKPPDGVLDIHGLTRDEAMIALETFFSDSRRQGFEKVLLVHGKGNHSSGEAVLKSVVREFIERCPYAGESGHAQGNSGGYGATWVLLK